MPCDLVFYVVQMNSRLGDIDGNTTTILAHIEKAKAQGADVIVFPELALTGYPPFDAWLHPEYATTYQAQLATIAQASSNIAIIIGHPAYQQGQCFNQASVFYEQTCILAYHKRHLPTYEIFDEKRYFSPGSPDQSTTFNLKGHCLQVAICADIWQPNHYIPDQGADALITINASPFAVHKTEQRHWMLHQCVQTTGLPTLYVNAVGGQDHLLFDGQTMCLTNGQAQPTLLCPYLQASATCLRLRQQHWHSDQSHTLPEPTQQLYDVLCASIRDYTYKNGFKTILIGVSGGIDSALTLALACQAIGPEHIQALTMPSPYTSDATLNDALKLCQNMGVSCQTQSINTLYQATLDTQPSLQTQQATTSLARQNIQARLRGLLLMSMANQTSALLLSCGNKSELALGYCTLYGDMAGGFAPLGDVSKTQVYQLAHWHNQQYGTQIPTTILTRPPTAELAPNQQDTDSLPPYEQLDPILEKGLANPFDPMIQEQPKWQQLMTRVQQNEFKRRQGAPYCRISTSSLQDDRRYPITLASAV